MGVGAHVGKEVLAPEEPTLEALGLGPVSYALLTTAPIAMGIVTPIFWGALWDSSRRWLLVVLPPVGELCGAALQVYLHLLALCHCEIPLPAPKAEFSPCLREFSGKLELDPGTLDNIPLCPLDLCR